MGEDLTQAVRDALDAVRDPETGAGLVTAGRVSGLTVRGDHVGFALEIAPERAAAFEPVRAAAEAAAGSVDGIAKVTAVLTAHQSDARNVQPQPPDAQANPLGAAGVKRIVAVASGKGGVGKSTVAANLACALAAQGHATGLLDADIYGPSAPILMGLEPKKPAVTGAGLLIPPQAYSVKTLSIGLLVDDATAMAWRGAMALRALAQMLSGAAWAPLDVLVIDMPPGTGDVVLSLVQRAQISGAVIVSTPQKLALADVRRGVELFRRTRVPLLGVVENMSAAVDPESGARFAPFGAGGAKDAADALSAPFLGAIPIDSALSEASDAGRPPAACAPDSPSGRAFADLAQGVWAGLATDAAPPPPEIVFT